eukprot:XP_001703032.1 hypothetical nucleotide reductase [Chlamydomonas reinhardtii]
MAEPLSILSPVKAHFSHDENDSSTDHNNNNKDTTDSNTGKGSPIKTGAAPPKVKLFQLPSQDKVALRDHSNHQQQAPSATTATASPSRNLSSASLASAASEPPSSPLPPGSRGLPSDYQAFIHTSRYARWVEAKRRRETWPETVNRYLDFMQCHLRTTCAYDLPPQLRAELAEAVIALEGARLRTFGGRASGPEPLEALFLFAVQLFTRARGRRLSCLECHDLVCKVAEIVVVGGVRRSALISLSDLSDAHMRTAKTGAWWEEAGQRALANNSAVYTEERPDMGVFMAEWKALYDSGSGERGLFSRAACRKQVLRSGGRRDPGWDFGTNPCSEIILRPYQFCNLTEVVVRQDDDAQSLARKVRLATLLGTFQSTLTDFPYLRDIWRTNTEAERLLGVSLTGIMDNTLTAGRRGPPQQLAELLEGLRGAAVAANQDMAAQLGIPASAAVTCVKPSGTVSQLVDAASGIHPRHAEYYIRRVRCTKDDPLTRFMADHGVPLEDCAMRPDTTAIASFPIKSPEGAVTRDDVSAISQLELCLTYQRHWCEHKPSITVTWNSLTYASARRVGGVCR